MKFCNQCGNQLEDDAVFCDKCGAQQAVQSQPIPQPVPIQQPVQEPYQQPVQPVQQPTYQQTDYYQPPVNQQFVQQPVEQFSAGVNVAPQQPKTKNIPLIVTAILTVLCLLLGIILIATSKSTVVTAEKYTNSVSNGTYVEANIIAVTPYIQTYTYNYDDSESGSGNDVAEDDKSNIVYYCVALTDDGQYLILKCSESEYNEYVQPYESNYQSDILSGIVKYTVYGDVETINDEKYSELLTSNAEATNYLQASNCPLDVAVDFSVEQKTEGSSQGGVGAVFLFIAVVFAIVTIVLLIKAKKKKKAAQTVYFEN